MNKNRLKFGSYIRELRLKLEIGQRELADKIGIAASYLNDIEKNKRSAPKLNFINKLSKILNTDKNFLNDLAGISKDGIAPDINEYINSNPRIVSILRNMKENNVDDNELDEIEKLLNKDNTKALIISRFR